MEAGRDADGALSPAPQVVSGADFVPASFTDLSGFATDDHLAAFRIFAATAAASLKGQKPLCGAKPADAALAAVFRAALAAEVGDDAAARDFFVTHFTPYRLQSEGGGFVTGYYEPVVPGSLVETEQFTAPILARPDDLASRRPYPDRAAIEAGAIAAHTRPLVWVEDPIEAFLIHVQGSARVILPDGEEIRLVYAGRNGQPYTSIGRLLIESGTIAPEAMSLAALKACVRAQGQKPGEPGRAVLQQNKSYIFFELVRGISGDSGPTGGAGLPLAALRAIAVDRTLWSYGLPFWLSGELPWQSDVSSPFRRLMIAQDTGSAIIGAAPADIFFGSGPAAGARAGVIRHACDFVVLLPRSRQEHDTRDFAAALG